MVIASTLLLGAAGATALAVNRLHKVNRALSLTKLGTEKLRPVYGTISLGQHYRYGIVSAIGYVEKVTIVGHRPGRFPGRYTHLHLTHIIEQKRTKRGPVERKKKLLYPRTLKVFDGPIR